jgi:hypothetical protein
MDIFSIVSEIRPIFELLYFASGVGLLAVAFFALRQIRIAKTDIVVRSKREAASIAATQCERYYKEIIPLANKFDLLLTEKEIPAYNSAIGDFTREHLLEEGGPSFCAGYVKKGDREFAGKVVEMLNALESFAVYFTEGIGDERIAFDSVGKTFCYTVAQYYPFIASVRRRGGDNYYNDVVKLFELWNARSTGSRLRGQLEEISAGLAFIEEKCINPLGTKI